jgi:hypothetical protein
MRLIDNRYPHLTSINSLVSILVLFFSREFHRPTPTQQPTYLRFRLFLFSSKGVFQLSA